MKTKRISILLVLFLFCISLSLAYAESRTTKINQIRLQRIRAKQAELQAELNSQKEKETALKEKIEADKQMDDNAPAQTPESFIAAASGIDKQLSDSLSELTKVREDIAGEKIPLSRKLSELEGNLVKARLDYQQTSRLLDSRTLDLSNLRTEIKTRQDEAAYLSNLLSEYIRNFESRLHIAEIQRYKKPLESAKLAPENTNLSQEEVFEAQAALLTSSIERLNETIGGTRFEGNAVVDSGLVAPGTFVLVGPSALFQSQDGKSIGTAEQRLGSLEPAVIGFENPTDSEAAAKVITSSNGEFPFDPTMGNAHKVESTKETFVEHVKKGGPIMFPILLMGFASFTVALYKWFSLLNLRKPSSQRLNAVLAAVSQQDKETAEREAKAIGGPIGKMLAVGAEHMNAPIEFIEEVMHEQVLATRLKINSLLPFIALTATCGPLLGLLGTVTGIITTFGLITVFGSGDPKTLSGGISEALVGTEYGLYVAIPSLLLHAFLSRKVRGFIDQMEKGGIAFINQLSKARLNASAVPLKVLAEDPNDGNGKKWKR